jgi:hypothetical protein
MTEQDIDRRLGEWMTRLVPEPDPAFVDRVVLAARIDHQLMAARRRSLRRALVDCSAAMAVGASFYLMSQMAGAAFDGVIVPSGPAMAGLVMLALWSAVALPNSRDRGLLARSHGHVHSRVHVREMARANPK